VRYRLRGLTVSPETSYRYCTRLVLLLLPHFRSIACDFSASFYHASPYPVFVLQHPSSRWCTRTYTNDFSNKRKRALYVLSTPFHLSFYVSHYHPSSLYWTRIIMLRLDPPVPFTPLPRKYKTSVAYRASELLRETSRQPRRFDGDDLPLMMMTQIFEVLREPIPT